MPRKQRDPYSRLPAAARRVIDRLRTGAVLCKSIRPLQPDQRGFADPVFRIEPGGKSVARSVAERILASGFVQPNSDGLFGADSSQTWRSA